jgi:hypothetical protein
MGSPRPRPIGVLVLLQGRAAEASGALGIPNRVGIPNEAIEANEINRIKANAQSSRYCRVDREGTGAPHPRGVIARDFVIFRGKISCIARARHARAGLTVYPPWIQIRDVAAPSSRSGSCDRKSKFGLRHAIKLIDPVYCMTKSEF